MNSTIEETKEYIGMWVTEDGYVRHELLPVNRYDEARVHEKVPIKGAIWFQGIILTIKMILDLQQMESLKMEYCTMEV